jgi:hypothetical protein
VLRAAMPVINVGHTIARSTGRKFLTSDLATFTLRRLCWYPFAAICERNAGRVGMFLSVAIAFAWDDEDAACVCLDRDSSRTAICAQAPLRNNAMRTIGKLLPG